MSETERPDVWSDEDGNYFGLGHIAPETFRAACLYFDTEICRVDPMEDGCGAMELEDVRHQWWYRIDTEDREETMHYCGPDHPGAEQFTAWYQW